MICSKKRRRTSKTLFIMSIRSKAQIHNETAQEYQKMMDALKKLQGSRIAVEAEASQPEETNRQPGRSSKEKEE